MNVLPDILATDSDLDSDYEESEEEIGNTLLFLLFMECSQSDDKLKWRQQGDDQNRDIPQTERIITIYVVNLYIMLN